MYLKKICFADSISHLIKHNQFWIMAVSICYIIFYIPQCNAAKFVNWISGYKNRHQPTDNVDIDVCFLVWGINQIICNLFLPLYLVFVISNHKSFYSISVFFIQSTIIIQHTFLFCRQGSCCSIGIDFRFWTGGGDVVFRLQYGISRNMIIIT